jgi:hypothetical protein
MSTNPNPNPTPDPNPQPKKRKKQNLAFADLLREWEALLGAVTDHGSELAPVEPHRTALADTLQRIKQAKVLQDSHRATKQRTTQKLKEMLVEGKDRAARLRGAIRAEMGTGNEQLVQFGIQPVRRRVTRSQQSAAASPPPAPELQEAKTGKGVQ